MKTQSCRTSPCWILALVLASQPAIAGEAAAPAAALLSKVNQEGTTGLAYETPEAREKLALQAEEFVDIFKKTSTAKACKKGKLDHPFCKLISDAAAAREAERRAASKSRQKRHNLSKVRGALLKAKLADLTDVPESQITKALGRIRGLDPLKPAVNAAIQAEGCPSPALLSALAAKMEEGFPADAYRALATSLYARASTCGDDAVSVKASYRLGLILVWSRKWQEAEAALVKASDHATLTDYRLRALYWRHYCARQMENTEMQAQLKSRLTREFPLSLHALLLSEGSESFAELAKLRNQDFEVKFRSASKPELNAAVAAAEALQANGAHHLSKQLLVTVMDRLKGSEEPFQLYVATLFRRSGEMIPKFQLLASLIRENPTLLSNSILEMMYPLRTIDLAKSHESTIDPYFVISLIRQESAFDERAKSPAGAVGLMQLMPRTARTIERRVAKRQLFDPSTNVRLGVKFVSRLMDRFNREPELALAAYNAGPLRVDEWLKRYPVQNRLLFVDFIPFKETREYVASIARNYYWYMKLYRQDQAPVSPQNFLFFTLFSAPNSLPTQDQVPVPVPSEQREPASPPAESASTGPDASETAGGV